MAEIDLFSAQNSKSNEGAESRILELIDLLNEYNYQYYILSQSTINDFKFDTLLAELEKLESEYPEYASINSPTKRVGGTITKSFETITHKYPMLSLGNTYSKGELADFETRVKKQITGDVEYTVELKYDGVAISLSYEDGKLVQAVTRGDGLQGDDVTINARTIKSIPLQLKGDYPKSFEIRGEVLMHQTTFNKLNEERKAANEDEYANPRNVASGTLKMQDSSVVAQRNLDCFLYSIIGEDLGIASNYENILEAKKRGFKVSSTEQQFIIKCTSIDQIMDFVAYWDDKRKNLPFDIDGVVVKKAGRCRLMKAVKPIVTQNLPTCSVCYARRISTEVRCVL
ncbi:MAG: hypothetical protein HRT72_03505, partial [Flavobacteriales bacterium]|nr:hypothetical protein [Flavobacteriales bacterium]